MPILDNPRHEKFAQAIASGMKGVDAYKSVYDYRGKAARQLAHALLKDVDISIRVKELQEESARGTVLTALERREFLARCVRADLNALDLEADGDLIQEKITTETEHGVTIKVKLPGKRECVMSDAELAGELKAGINVTVGVTVTREPLDALRSRIRESVPAHGRS